MQWLCGFSSLRPWQGENIAVQIRGWSFITCEGVPAVLLGGVTFWKLVACGGPSLNSWHPLGGSYRENFSISRPSWRSCCGTDQTGVKFEKFIMHFQPFKRLKFKKFPWGSMPPNPPSQCTLCLPVRPVSPWSSPADVALCADWLFGVEHKETVAKDERDELTQLLKYEKHDLYRNAFGSGFGYTMML